MKSKPTATATEAKTTPQQWQAYRVQKREKAKKEKEKRDAAEKCRAEKALRRAADEERKKHFAAQGPNSTLSATQRANLRKRAQKKQQKQQQQQQQQQQQPDAVEESPAAEPAEPPAPATVEDDLDIYEDEKTGEVAPQTAKYVCPGKYNARWEDARKGIFKQ